MNRRLFSLAIIAALCLPAFAQGPNTVLIGSEGITVTAISSPTAVLQFGAGLTWNTITSPNLPLIVSCSSACPQLGGDPVQGVLKSLYATQQSTAYTVTLSNGTSKTVPALSPPPAPTTATYKVTCTFTIPSASPLPLKVTLICGQAVKQ